MKAYVAGLPKTWEVVFVASPSFGKKLWKAFTANEQCVVPEFLAQEFRGRHEWIRLLKLRLLHGKLKAFLRKSAPDLVIVGDDSRGVGRWAASVGKELGIPIISCQEGCRWLYVLHVPILIRLKQILLSVFSRVLYKAGYYHLDFHTANYAAVWGESTAEWVIRSGVSKQNVFIVGAPSAQMFSHASRKPVSSAIIFLDAPVRAWPKGTVELRPIDEFRKELIRCAATLNLQLIYKIHPLTTESEEELVRQWANGQNHVVFEKDMVAEEIIPKMSACIAFPSTAIFNALLNGIPVIQVLLQARGFKKMLWDPVRDYGAGITIHRKEDLLSAIRRVRTSEWLKEYIPASRNAARSVLGPLDGRATERFYELIHKAVGRAA